MASLAQIFKNFDKRLDHEEIDEFLAHLNASLNHRIKKLEEDERTTSPDQFDDPGEMDGYQDHLRQLMSSAYDVKALGNELSIIALYKKVETHTSRVLKDKVTVPAGTNLSFFTQLCKALPFKIETVDGFAAFNELRLLNNCIKHEGTVSNDLAKAFPSWTLGAKISDLDIAFARLLPDVKRYVSDFAEKLYAARS
jgi:hypothetical protein